MDDSATRRGGFNRVVIGRIEQSAGHFKANRGTDHKSPDEEDDERLGKVDDQETNDQSDEAAAENILTELLLKGVEDQAAKHTANKENCHCSSGKCSSAHAALGDDERDVRTHDAVGVNEHKNDRAKQPRNGGNLEMALLATRLSGLVSGEVDASEHQRDQCVKESKVGVVPCLGSKNAADKGQVHAAAIGEKILNTHELAAFIFGIVLSDDAIGCGHKEAEAKAEDGLPHHELNKAGVQRKAEDGIGNNKADTDLAQSLFGHIRCEQR